MRRIAPHPSRHKSKIRQSHRRSGASGWLHSLNLQKFWVMGTVVLVSVGGFTLLLKSNFPQYFTELARQSTANITGCLGFKVADVLVEGRSKVNKKNVLRAVAIKKGDPIFAHNLQHIKERLEKISWVRKATIQRRLPNILYIRLVERQPIALWQHQKHLYMVDDQGVVIKGKNIEPYKNLPIIIGKDAPLHAPEMLQQINQYPDIRKQLTAMIRVGNRRWDLRLNQKLEVRLPETEVENALQQLSQLIQQQKLTQLEVKTLDLRLPKQMTMRLSPLGAVQARLKGKET